MQKGCACKFLYGPGTDEEKKTEIEKALESKTELQTEVQFYKKNGKSEDLIKVSADVKLWRMIQQHETQRRTS